MASNIHVVATTFEGTRAALTAAVPLARGLGTGLTIVVPHIVASAAERDIPARPAELGAKRYDAVARRVGGESVLVEICTSVGFGGLFARLCACGAPVVVGGAVGRWLTSPEERFANRLAIAGCHVIFVASGANRSQRRVAA